jgi:hypothetical protein
MKTRKIIGCFVIILVLSAHNAIVCSEIENSYNTFWLMVGGWFFGIVAFIGLAWFIDWCMKDDTKKSA